MIFYTAASGIWQTVWLEAVPERYNRAFKLLPDVDKQELKLTIDFLSRGKTIDEVKSYFGMRKFSIEKDSRGVKRLFLNNQPLFQNGSLDQGYWPDGLFTAPTDEALRYDLEITKQVGFYMTSKNIKIEPAHWYYHCDQLGLIVWQDMPRGGGKFNLYYHVLVPYFPSQAL